MTYQDLMEAIAAEISDQFPDRMIYRDFCPTAHQRPSFFLYVTNAAFSDAAIGLVQWEFEAELTLFAAKDEYDMESTEVLRMDQLAVMNLFGGPSLKVNDRSVPLTVSAPSPGAGEAYVIFTAKWIDQRPGYVERDPNTENMEQFVVNMNGKEGCICQPQMDCLP